MKLKIFNYVLVGFRNTDGKLIINILKNNEHNPEKRLLYQVVC
jgi:hypothetical protein